MLADAWRPASIVLVLAARLGAPSLAVQQTGAAASPVQEIPHLHSALTIDGRMDEPAWQDGLEIALAYEVQPGDAIAAIVETRCRLGYDDEAFYLGCHALDPEPESIRAHLTDRDTAFGDDWIGVYLDTFNDARRGYGFFANPLGVQMDLSRNEAGGGDEEDTAWDTIWDAAGSLTEDGYIVEIAIPFRSLSFQRTVGAQTWGITVQRNHERSIRRVFASTPFRRSRNCTLCQLDRFTGFAGAEPGHDVELTPTLTANRSERATGRPGDLDDRSERAEAGLTATWGLTPNLILAATANPDFSQVEADSPQLEVNERFALLFPEKRPFFLEGADVFDTFFNAVHTRTIADPDWGLKLTGKEGRHAFGVFAARDALTSLLLPGSQESRLASLDEESTDAVVRYQRDVGESSTVGALTTSREAAGYRNQLAGFDSLVRWSDHDTLEFQVLGSRSEYPDAIVQRFGQPAGGFSDTAWTAEYMHATDEWFLGGAYEDVGRDFRADLGFMPQVDFRRGNLVAGYTWWGEEDDPYTRVDVVLDWERLEDQQGHLLEEEVDGEVSFQGPLQSFFDYEVDYGDQNFGGVRFRNLLAHSVAFEMQPSGSLTFGLEAAFGDTIDSVNVRPAEHLVLTPSLTLRPGRHLRLSAFHARRELEVAAGRLFTEEVSELVAIYQFDVRTFLRLILQRQAQRREVERFAVPAEPTAEDVLAQLLFSYKINPHTVAFLGYSETRSRRPELGLEPTDRTVFLKIGYAWTL